MQNCNVEVQIDQSTLQLQSRVQEKYVKKKWLLIDKLYDEILVIEQFNSFHKK